MSIAAYTRDKPAPEHCQVPMLRHFEVAPGLAMVGEAHYEGLRAQDGTDISSRAKHRAYMKANNLTTIDDFTNTWAKQRREAQDRQDGVDPTRAADIAQAIEKLGG